MKNENDKEQSNDFDNYQELILIYHAIKPSSEGADNMM